MSNEKWLKAAIIWINNIANPNRPKKNILKKDNLGFLF